MKEILIVKKINPQKFPLETKGSLFEEIKWTQKTERKKMEVLEEFVTYKAILYK